MNNRESNKKVGIYKKSIKMKRIALILLSAISIVACKDEQVPVPTDRTDINSVNLAIHIPKNSASTYASEDASEYENNIDSLYIELYHVPGNVINLKGFNQSDYKYSQVDSVVEVAYTVENITAGQPLYANVYANRKQPAKISGDIPLPDGTLAKSFYMSGIGTLALNGAGTSYVGTVNVVRNVAKLRTNVLLNSVYFPDDLEIDYEKIILEVIQTSDTTTGFASTSPTGPIGGLISYPARTGNNLRAPSAYYPINNSTFTGGQIDSLYLYENYRSNYGVDGANATKIKITIPTKSLKEGNKTAEYIYTLEKSKGVYDILRNYIYTLNIKICGQSLDPLITLDIDPWNDINLPIDIGGTYLTTDVSEIVFDPVTREATINFCTDAQAVYFNYSNFNGTNTAQIGTEITPIGIEKADHNLAPTNYSDGQILLDQRHCGSFKFKLDDNFPGFPNINFSGSICMKAGNIVKCFTFPGVNLYDAHFIVGEPLFPGDNFTSAQVDGGANGWLEISRNRLYTGASASITTGSGAVYLHLNENLTGVTRSGSVTLTNSSGSKKINISQLSAIPVGRFGYNATANPTTDVFIYNAGLFTEQLHEYDNLVQYARTNSIATPGINYVYNGLGMITHTSATVLDAANYNNASFQYGSANYSAINYCAYKNRGFGTNGNLRPQDVLWYLPAQAQLMGMWTAYESFKDISTSTFIASAIDSVSYWSATANNLYNGGGLTTAEAQYVNFRFGNVGHTRMYSGNDSGNQRFWTRCVRNAPGANYTSSSMTTSGTSNIDFSRGMPAYSYVTGPGNSKVNATGNENSTNNKTLFGNLRVAIDDAPSPVEWSATACSGYSETGAGVGTWRLPTQRELMAIWILQSEIKTGYPAFNLLRNDDYYWSATESASYSNNAWVVFGSIGDPGGSGNSPHRLKTERSRVRCVREL